MKTILFFFLTLSTSIIFAQPRVITFGSNQDETESIDEIHSLKLHTLEFISADYSLYYELALTHKISTEVSIGMTFGDDWGNEASDHFYNSMYVDPKLGYSFSVAIRFYPIEVFEEIYIAPEYKFRSYGWDNHGTLSGNLPVVDKQEETRTYSMPRIAFGYITYLFNNVTIDTHLGFGLNTKKERMYDQTIEEHQNYTIGPKPRIHGGFKIAYVF